MIDGGAAFSFFPTMKNHHKGNPVPHVAPKTAPDRDEVARRAYAIWENEGHPPDRHEAHWLEAEKQLDVGDSAVSEPDADLS